VSERTGSPRWREAFNACANYEQLKEGVQIDARESDQIDPSITARVA